MKNMLLVFAVFLLFSACKQEKKQTIIIHVDAGIIHNTLAGGMGASWHAISKDLPLNNENYSTPVRELGPRGSAFGGNPPASDMEAWGQLRDHASWLGLNFVRVELSQRMYEPEKGVFDWNNEEMQALYHILDWAQENQVDVFLQQMWMNVEWNSIPGIHPIISAPMSLDDFAHGISTMLQYMVEEKGYSCIKYFCMVNEPPGGSWGYWWNEGSTLNTTEAAWARLAMEFDKRNILIPIAGPDWTDLPEFDVEKLGFSESLGAIDIHSYHGISDAGEENLRKWADWSHGIGKPFFLTEYGNMNLGWGEDDPNPKSFDAAISNACDVIRGLRAGVDGFNRWSFTNRGDIDGQWQLVQTYNRETKNYFPTVQAEPEAYYGFGIISRFLSKYSSVVALDINQADSVLMSAALLSPAGKLSVIMVNVTDEPQNIQLRISSFPGQMLHVYQVDKHVLNRPDFALHALYSSQVQDGFEIHLPPRSITNASSYFLSHDARGIIVE